MQTITAADLKYKFPSILDTLYKGEDVIIEHKNRKKSGIIIPYEKYKPVKRKIGILENKASFEINEDFKITDEELLSL